MKVCLPNDKLLEGKKRGSLRGDSVRFIGAGIFNTVLTLLLYQLLLLFSSPELAYSLSWLVGLVFVVVFYPGRVFPGGGQSWRERLAIGATYIFVFMLGFFLLRAFIFIGVPSRSAILFVIIATTVLNFFVARLISYFHRE